MFEIVISTYASVVKITVYIGVTYISKIPLSFCGTQSGRFKYPKKGNSVCGTPRIETRRVAFMAQASAHALVGQGASNICWCECCVTHLLNLFIA